MISDRPPKGENFAVLGQWEGDLILSLESAAIGAKLERTNRFSLLLHLFWMKDRMPSMRVTDLGNRLSLMGHGPAAVPAAFTRAMLNLPTPL